MKWINQPIAVQTKRLLAVEILLAGVLLLLASGVVWQGRSFHMHKAHAAGRDAPPAAGDATRMVSFTCCEYTPSQLTIQAGDTIQWNGSFASHPLVSDTGLWSTVSTGSSFSHTFNTPGRYRYHCSLHGGPNGAGMSGTITVVLNLYLPVVKK